MKKLRQRKDQSKGTLVHNRASKVSSKSKLIKLKLNLDKTNNTIYTKESSERGGKTKSARHPNSPERSKNLAKIKKFRPILEKKPQRDTLGEKDSKISRIVASSKSQIDTSEVSSAKRQGCGKGQKNRQPKQVNGFYKKPSLLSNFSTSIVKPNEETKQHFNSFVQTHDVAYGFKVECADNHSGRDRSYCKKLESVRPSRNLKKLDKVPQKNERSSVPKSSQSNSYYEQALHEKYNSHAGPSKCKKRRKKNGSSSIDLSSFMSGERSIITFPGRQTIESKKPIMSVKEYNNTIDRLTKENEDFKDQIADLRKVLTQHKNTIEESAVNNKDLQDTLIESNNCLRSMITTQFVFIDFFKQVEKIPQIASCNNRVNFCEVSNELEKILVNEGEKISSLDLEVEKFETILEKTTQFLETQEGAKLKVFVKKFSDDHGQNPLKVYNQEYDLNQELGFESERKSTKLNEPDSCRCNTMSNNSKLEEENDWFRKQIKQLNNSLKKAKQNKHSMYFRNDRKMMELNRVTKERNKLQEKVCIVENELHAQKMINIDKTEELRLQKERYDQLENDFEQLRINFDERISNSVRTTEKPLKSKIKSLEYEIKILKEKLNFTKQQYDVAKKNDQVMQVMDDLSRMILSKNNDPNFLTREKKALIKSLFGDYATNFYKQEITILKSEILSLRKTRDEDIKNSLRYLEALMNFDEYKDNKNLLMQKDELLSQIQSNRNSSGNQLNKKSYGVPEFSIFSSEDDEGSHAQNSPRTLFKPELEFSEFNLIHDEKLLDVDFESK
ncbi:unnamed protein product [Moneuplotes crassus]|uniref:Uncharacterized protein n=1 Tax=Euplotes crassus TaxID=5936 RepID=A0AAD1XV56_EUPCR|nr:unnamed protein product [Moneuplotes crassus]